MTMTTETLVKADIPGLKLMSRGKVRDIYDLGPTLLIVTTDRLSAFDVVLPTPIPDKGRVLTQMSAFWFKKLGHVVPNHLLTAEFKEIVREALPGKSLDAGLYDGRLMLVKKAKRLDAECVVRGYLMGSGWKEYQKTGAVCGHKLPAGLVEAQKLPKPIFTPSTKAEKGHDENITIEQMGKIVGDKIAAELERLSLALYEAAAAYMEKCGLILADTKFEFGLLGDKVILIDEAITPDSSRFWDVKTYKPGRSPESFDKQFVRDYLERIAWNKLPPGPSLPPEVVEGTSQRYREALRRLECPRS
jgi:phosphoribosylaminoimidazole-succinocarboxamide synthase